jgi:hypothetical protein
MKTFEEGDLPPNAARIRPGNAPGAYAEFENRMGDRRT